MANQMLAEVEKALASAPAQVDPTLSTPVEQERLALPDVIVTTGACLGVAIIAAVPTVAPTGRSMAGQRGDSGQVL